MSDTTKEESCTNPKCQQTTVELLRHCLELRQNQRVLMSLDDPHAIINAAFVALDPVYPCFMSLPARCNQLREELDEAKVKIAHLEKNK